MIVSIPNAGLITVEFSPAQSYEISKRYAGLHLEHIALTGHHQVEHRIHEKSEE